MPRAANRRPLAAEPRFRSNVRDVVDKVALGRVFFRVLRFLPVTVIPPVLHTHLQLHAALNID
jgi:hypothetical protein